MQWEEGMVLYRCRAMRQLDARTGIHPAVEEERRQSDSQLKTREPDGVSDRRARPNAC